MDNLKSPAYPQLTYDIVPTGDGKSISIHYTDKDFPGFTKLEKAALMIAGHIWEGSTHGHEKEIARRARALAEAVLEECN